MTKKKILPILLATCLSFSTLLYGCGKDDTTNDNGSVKEDIKDAGEDAKNSVENAGEAVKDAAEDVLHLGTNLVDKTMDYSKDEFKKALDDAGLKVEEVKERTDHFSVKGEEYKVNGQTITVYEYDKADAQLLQNDLDTVTNTGTITNVVNDNSNTKDVTNGNNKDATGTADGTNGGERTITNWNGTAHIYKKGRVVVVYEGDDATTLTNLKDILGDPILG